MKILKSLKLNGTSKNQFFGFRHDMKRSKNTFIVSLEVFKNFDFFVEIWFFEKIHVFMRYIAKIMILDENFEVPKIEWDI